MHFITKETPEKLYEVILEEISKFQDPIVIPDATNLKIVASYYKVKPPKGGMIQRGNS